MSREMLNETTWNSPEIRRAFATRTSTMTYGGVALKTLLFLALIAGLAAIGWANADAFIGRGAGLLYLVGFLVLIAISVAAVHNPALALVAGLFYSILNGMWIGAISRYYETTFDGIVGLALFGTLMICLAVIALFAIGGFRVSPRGAQIISVLVLAVSLLYLVSWVLSWFGITVGLLYDSTPGALLLGLLILGVAASTLLVDLTYVEQGIAAGVPRAAEWYAAFGIVSSIVWIYLEVLRMLARLANRQS